METNLFCQSCTMPIDDIGNRGTEKDGSKSRDYCRYCYQNGAFTTPNMALEEMKSIVVTEMKKTNIPDGIIQTSLEMLPHLKRWQKVQV